MQRLLTPNDFHQESIDDGAVRYWQCVMGDGIELVIEPVNMGMLVAIYSADGMLLQPKRTVGWVHDMLGIHAGKASSTFDVAVQQASDMYQTHLATVIPGFGKLYFDGKVLTLA